MRDTIGKFQILKLIGKGAMGEVYLGRDPLLGREVAIKTIQADSAFGPEAQARFEREARAAGSLNHPNIVTVYEFGKDGDLYYLAMEYVAGEDLEALIARKGLTKPQFLEVLIQTCEGLAFAHERGIIHRDVKPANVLVGRTGRRLMAKLMDFGIALVGRSNLTQEGVWMGTINYMAPEYLDSGQASTSSDLFAIGVMLYEVLAEGRKPFSGETTSATLNRILRQSPEPLKPADIEGLDARILEVVDRALAKAPADRYASALDLSAALEEVLSGKAPVLVPPPQLIPPEELSEPAKTTRSTPAFREPSGPVVVVSKAGQGNCMSIRVALRHAKPGTQVHVMPGTYREALLVDRPLEILAQGAPGEVVLEGLRGPALTLRGNGIRVRGLTLRAPADPGALPIPALIVDAGRPELDLCTLQASAGTSLVVQGRGTGPTFKDCLFEGGAERGAYIRGESSAVFRSCQWVETRDCALEVEAGGHAQLEGCRLQGLEGAGLRLTPRSQATLADTALTGFPFGCLEVQADARADIRGGSLARSLAGIFLLERGQAMLEGVELTGHGGSALHVLEGASATLKSCRITQNPGFGISILRNGSVSAEGCDLAENGQPGVLIHRGASAHLRECKLRDGRSLGIRCLRGGRGVLEACEIVGNAQSGARVEAGGSLLLMGCVIRDGQATGLMLFEEADVTLEECVVHRNARGGILLAKDASDPMLRGANTIEDGLFRVGAQGEMVRVAPLGQH